MNFCVAHDVSMAVKYNLSAPGLLLVQRKDASGLYGAVGVRFFHFRIDM